MYRTFAYIGVGLAAPLLPVLTAGQAYAHGWITSPPSRAALCAEGVIQDCGAIQWEPQSVEGPGGFPEAGPQDGELCSGGNGRFAELDDPRGGDWPAENVNAGGTYSFSWNLTARHSTADFRYYITQNGWDPSQPLSRSDLDLTPIASVDYDGEQPGSTVTHDVTLPSGKDGRHLVFAVWEVADTANAFYQCTDVAFGDGDGGGDDPPPTECDADSWAEGTAYTSGDVVSHDGHEWEAQWWTKQEPSASQWGPWDDLGSCA